MNENAKVGQMSKDQKSIQNSDQETTIDDVFDIADQLASQAENDPDAQKMLETAAQKVEGGSQYEF